MASIFGALSVPGLEGMAVDDAAQAAADRQRAAVLGPERAAELGAAQQRNIAGLPGRGAAEWGRLGGALYSAGKRILTLPASLGAADQAQRFPEAGDTVSDSPIDPAALSGELALNLMGLPGAAPAGSLGANALARTKGLPLDLESRMARAREQGFTIDAYHGTNQPITEFDNSRLGASTRSHSSKKAAFFTDDPALASDYAANAGNNVVADVARHEKAVEAARMASERLERVAQRSGKNSDWKAHEAAFAKWEDLEIGALRADPVTGQNVIPAKLRLRNPLSLDAGGGSLNDLAKTYGKHLHEMMPEAMAAGHDGVVIRNLVDGPKLMGDYAPSTHYAVFDPANIRSRFAAFDPANEGSGFLLGANRGGVPFGLLPWDMQKK